MIFKKQHAVYRETSLSIGIGKTSEGLNCFAKDNLSFFQPFLKCRNLYQFKLGRLQRLEISIGMVLHA